MEEGKSYRVIYKDDKGQKRVKDLKFVKNDGDLRLFINLISNREEAINVNQIIRYEEKEKRNYEKPRY